MDHGANATVKIWTAQRSFRLRSQVSVSFIGQQFKMLNGRLAAPRVPLTKEVDRRHPRACVDRRQADSSGETP